ncbi:hypothetical protein [Sphingomonas sp. BK580]|uniref:hypothetical protein n=1 Tax=Sphingomonas sp. BK580 TaxID=2586972 RepID=UPI00160DBBC0|nr:hypothetical protein [Sphingomonas sp. BK580]MBB3695573.1 hypothetical protein [Sphingomonas sp. BK580]
MAEPWDAQSWISVIDDPPSAYMARGDVGTFSVSAEVAAERQAADRPDPEEEMKPFVEAP